MIMKTVKDFFEERAIEFLRDYRYAYGAKESTGILTTEKLNQLAANSPDQYTDDYKSMTAKNIGWKVIDCSGLVCSLLGVANMGSSQLAELPHNNPDFSYITGGYKWGDIFWKKGHVGIYIGNDRILEAKSVAKGVVISGILENNWKKVIRFNPWHLYKNIGWCQDGNRWWYTIGESRGDFYRNCTVEIDGKMYSFDNDGYLKGDK